MVTVQFYITSIRQDAIHGFPVALSKTVGSKYPLVHFFFKGCWDYKQLRPWLSVEDLEERTRASELFLWSRLCPSSTTNHFEETQDLNPHKSEQLYWLSCMIYVRRRDLAGKRHRQPRISSNVALNQNHVPKMQSINTTITSFHYNFSLFSRRTWCPCYSPRLSSWVGGHVKDNQQNDVMFVRIKMGAMEGKWSMKNGTLGRLSQDKLINRRIWCSQSWLCCRLHCLLIDYHEMFL